MFYACDVKKHLCLVWAPESFQYYSLLHDTKSRPDTWAELMCWLSWRIFFQLWAFSYFLFSLLLQSTGTNNQFIFSENYFQSLPPFRRPSDRSPSAFCFKDSFGRNIICSFHNENTEDVEVTRQNSCFVNNLCSPTFSSDYWYSVEFFVHLKWAAFFTFDLSRRRRWRSWEHSSRSLNNS